MYKIIDDIKKCKESNFVFLLTKDSDIKRLQAIINIDKKVIEKIKKDIKDTKNKVLNFYIGSKEIENIYIICVLDKKDKEVDIFLGEEARKLPNDIVLYLDNQAYYEKLINAVVLGRYKFQKYLTERKEDDIKIFVIDEIKKDLLKRLKTIENIIYARDLSSTPGNDLFPASFAEYTKKEKFKNVKIKIFDTKKIEKKGLNLLYSVGKASDNKPYMIVLEKIVNKDYPTIALVGKGITFDTGGIQVKPGSVMYDMKGDMSGAATVLGVMKELDEKKTTVNIIGCIVLAENHISGNSLKPSDIIKSYSGKTVDIIHTDAEGRLILADGISYVSNNYKLDKVITIATLTGACEAALGYRYAGVMGNDEKFIGQLLTYSENNLEKYWRLPFGKYYVEKTKGEVADLKNLSEKVRAGASMGGAFLYNFILNDEKFTHIDIAGAAINSGEAFGYINSGMTGFGVDSLSKIISEL